MAKRQIDSFKVKPSGIGVKWRGRIVYFDEQTYEITSECPASGECMNLTNIGDYKHNDRKFIQGQKITEFCSVFESSNIEIYAEDQEPFASAQVTPFSPKCGFIEPPAPPHPFGDPSTYRLYKFFEAFGVDSRYWRLEIERKSYVGVATQIASGPKNAIRKRYENGGSVNVTSTNPVDAAKVMDYKFYPIVKSELEITLVSDEDFALSELYTDDERAYKVTLKVKPNQAASDDLYTIDWVGFIMPDYCQEPFKSVPYHVTLRCTEVLNTLTAVPYPMPKAITQNPKQSLLAAISYCLYSTNLMLPFYITDNLYEIEHKTTMDDDPLDQTFVNPFRFTDDAGKIMSCYEVLKSIAVMRGARVFQADGAFHFERVIEKSRKTVTRRKYTARGLFLYSEQVVQTRNAGLRKEVELVNYNANMPIDAAYKMAAVHWKYGYSPAIILNGNFEQYNDGLFDYWAIINDLQFSRTQKTIKDSAGLPVVTFEDYMFTFDEEYDPTKYVQPNPINVDKGDKISLYLNIDSQGPIDIMYFRAFVGSWYIGNVDGALGDELGWAQDFSTARRVLSGKKDVNTYQHALDLGEMPIQGELFIQFLGFQKYKSSGRTNTGGARPESPGVPLEMIPAPYTPVSIDNVTIAINRELLNDNIPKGVTYISQQQKLHTTIAEPVEMLFGDARELIRTRGNNVGLPEDRPTRVGDFSHGQIGILYRKSGATTVKWSDGIFPHAPLGQILAKSILTAYQRPARFFEADFLSNDLGFLNTLEIDLLPNQLYMFLSAEFDILNNLVERAILCEIIGDPVRSIDANFPSLPNFDLPPITQNPNAPITPIPTGTKIFTGQFNEVFA